MKRFWRKLFPVRTIYVPHVSSPRYSHVVQFQNSCVLVSHEGDIWFMSLDYSGQPTFQRMRMA